MKKTTISLNDILRQINLYLPIVYPLFVIASFYCTYSYITYLNIDDYYSVSIASYIQMSILFMPFAFFLYIVVLLYLFIACIVMFQKTTLQRKSRMNSWMLLTHLCGTQLPLVAMMSVSKYNKNFLFCVIIYFIFAFAVHFQMKKNFINQYKISIFSNILLSVYTLVLFALAMQILLKTFTDELQATLWYSTILITVTMIILHMYKKRIAGNKINEVSVYLEISFVVIISIFYLNNFLSFETRIQSILFRISMNGNYFVDLPNKDVPEVLRSNSSGIIKSKSDKSSKKMYSTVYIYLKDDDYLFVLTSADAKKLLTNRNKNLSLTLYQIDKHTYELKHKYDVFHKNN